MRMRREADQGGEAVIEFIVLTVALVIPVLYLVLSLASVQASVFAAEAGAREAVRVLAADPQQEGTALAQIDLAFEDFGLGGPDDVEFQCVPASCSGDVARMRVRVDTTVPLPLVPGWVGQRGLLPVSATSEALVEGLSVDG